MKKVDKKLEICRKYGIIQCGLEKRRNKNESSF